jgi:predicted nucleic acid-binding protein
VNTVFLDTVGLLATWDQSDQWHSAAATASNQLQTSGSLVVTTTYVLLECGNAAARRPYRTAVDRLRQALDTAGCLIRPTAADWDAAWQAYLKSEGAGAGIVDQVSFVVMRRLGIGRVLTNDQHFAAAGFELLF